MTALSKPEQLSPFGDALAGSLSAVFANACVYPLDIIKTRLQVQGNGKDLKESSYVYKGTLDAINRIVQTEGILGLYTGLPATLIGVAATNFSYFFFYALVRSNYIKRYGRNVSVSTSAELLLGAIAGTLAQIFTIPVSVVATRQQTAKKENKKSLWSTVLEIINEDGITGLWRGLRPSLILVINPSITYGMFGRIQKFLYGDEKLTPIRAFIVGAISKTLATVVTYPYIMAKVRLQAKYDDEEMEEKEKEIEINGKSKHKYKGAIDVLHKVHRKEGFLGWYKGMQAQVTKAVLSQALLFMYKEKFNFWTYLLLHFISQRISKKTNGSNGSMDQLPIEIIGQVMYNSTSTVLDGSTSRVVAVKMKS